MESKISLLQTVALLEDVPEHGLTRGQVGIVVEDLALGSTRWSSAITTDVHTQCFRCAPIN